MSVRILTAAQQNKHKLWWKGSLPTNTLRSFCMKISKHTSTDSRMAVKEWLKLETHVQKLLSLGIALLRNLRKFLTSEWDNHWKSMCESFWSTCEMFWWVADSWQLHNAPLIPLLSCSTGSSQPSPRRRWRHHRSWTDMGPRHPGYVAPWEITTRDISWASTMGACDSPFSLWTRDWSLHTWNTKD